MSGAFAGVPNAFASAVTATGLQLDNNNNTITAYLNDPTNRNNYIADSSGGTNTVVLTFAPPVVGGYTTGLEITFKAANTNTGAVVVNANGLGNKNLVNQDSSAMQSGQVLAGSVYKAAYDGTQFIFISAPAPATKAAMQTATASATFITPSQALNHPGVAKAWVSFNGTLLGTQTVTTNGFNVSQIVRAGTGTYAIVFKNAFNGTNFSLCGAASPSGVVGPVGSLDTATTTINVFASTTGAAADVGYVSAIFFGNLA